MQIHRVRLKNFRLHADTDVQFGPGITALVGPNGSGKSTLLEGIAWTFYGTSAARGPRDTIRRADAPAREPVRAEVEFSLGGHDYRVVRKLNNAELFLDHANAPVANSHRTVTDRITQLLGMDQHEFFSTYFTGQKELAVMASMGPADRGKFLSRLMGYERLREAQTRLRARRTELRSAIAEVERTVEAGQHLRKERETLSQTVSDTRTRAKRAEQELKDARQEFDAVSPQWQEMQGKRDRAIAMDAEHKMALQKVEEARREFERLDRELAEAVQAGDELKVLRPILDEAEARQQEFEELDKAAQAAGRVRDLHGEHKAITEQLDGVARRLSALANAAGLVKEAETAEREAEVALQELKERGEEVRTRWTEDKQDAETRHRSLRNNYVTIKDDRAAIEQGGSAGKCPTCARPLGEELDTVLDTLQRQLEEIESQGIFLKQRVKQLSGEPEELKTIQQDQRRLEEERKRAVNALVEARARQKERADAESEHERLCARQAEITAEIADLPDAYDVDRHEALRLQLREMQNDVKRAAALHERAQRAEGLMPQAEQAEKTLSVHEADASTLEASVKELGFDQAHFDTLSGRYEAADRTVRSAELAVRDVSGQLQIAERDMQDLDRRIAEHGERVERLGVLRTDLNLHDELDQAFDELRRDLNARLRPDLSEVASGFLAELTDGRYHELELTEKYDILVLEDGLPRNVISGGEEDIANLVLRVAISQMVAERAGQPLSLLVLDEIFGGLDADRRRNVIDLLRGLASRFPQVILITHIEQVRQGVDRVLRVELDPRGGSSRITEDELKLPGAEHAAA